GNHINAQIRKFILEKFPLARKQQIKDSDPLLESGVLDSLGVLDLVTFVEQEFSVHVVDDELVPENFQTIDRIASFIETKSNT
ncbi:MAG: acyl carrier protein, partial [Candidatus Acidiferrum sp.]